MGSDQRRPVWVDDVPVVMTPARWARDAAALGVATAWAGDVLYEVSIVTSHTPRAMRRRAFDARRQRKGRQLARALTK